MATPWESPIIRISSGALNNVNDTVIAGVPSIGSRSKYAGQLGKRLFVSADQIAQLTLAATGTLYGGRYRYVKRRLTDDDSPALAPGKIAFWDTTVTSWETAYQVTTDENLSSSSNAMVRAGIFLNNIEPGNYGFIQDLGEVYVRFCTVLTTTAAIGQPVYAAAKGDTGADQGTVDNLVTDSTAIANARFMGWAVEAPSAFGLKRIMLAEDAVWNVF